MCLFGVYPQNSQVDRENSSYNLSNFKVPYVQTNLDVDMLQSVDHPSFCYPQLLFASMRSPQRKPADAWTAFIEIVAVWMFVSPSWVWLSLVGALEHEFYFSIQLGIVIPTDFHICQMGSNHQPDLHFMVRNRSRLRLRSVDLQLWSIEIQIFFLQFVSRTTPHLNWRARSNSWRFCFVFYINRGESSDLNSKSFWNIFYHLAI